MLHSRSILELLRILLNMVLTSVRLSLSPPVYLPEYEKQNLINAAKKHSKTIENTVKHGSNKSYNQALLFAEVNFVCKHSLSFRPRPTKGVRLKVFFIMKVRATTDGQALLTTHFNKVHNHDTSEEEFKLNHKQRRVGP